MVAAINSYNSFFTMNTMNNMQNKNKLDVQYVNNFYRQVPF